MSKFPFSDIKRISWLISLALKILIQGIILSSLDCDIVVKFSKPQLFGSQGMIDQTYFEMGSTQSRPCSHKSPKVNSMDIVYAKKGSQFRANQVPTYGPVGVNNCIGPGDRPYENYSMLKNFESLSLAKKYCNMYANCDIIVEIDRNQGKKLLV